ncbi:MAG: alpha/beta hydrolase [Pseudomonadota bacterium]
MTSLMKMDEAFDAQMTRDKAQLDFELSPSKSAKDASGILSWMQAETDRARSSLQCVQEIRYGDAPRACYDIFQPIAAEATPCLVFLHGGFWQEGDKGVSGFAAAPWVASGWSYVSLGYDLAPRSSLSAIVAQVEAAIWHLSNSAQDRGIDPAKIILAGHSAGAHLAACIATDVSGTGVAQTIAGAALISGVFELAPLARSYVNDLVDMRATDVAHLSPLRRAPARALPLHIAVGADEPEPFRTQSEVLARQWAPQLPSLSFEEVPGRDHFDVLEELANPVSNTGRAIMNMVK